MRHIVGAPSKRLLSFTLEPASLARLSVACETFAAVQLDRRGVAEMSCIAGVGGDVPKLVALAQSGRPIVALDGCPLVCVKSSLARHGITPARHYQLHEYGVKKRNHQDFDPAQAAQVLGRVEADLIDHPLRKEAA